MFRFICKRMAQLVVLSAGLLSTETYVFGIQCDPGATACDTSGGKVCCNAGYDCCPDNGGYCTMTCGG